MNKRLKRFMILFITVIAIFSLGIFIFMQQSQFGKHPSGERLTRILKSPNYKNGEFKNLNETPVMTGDAGYFSALKDMMFAKNTSPLKKIPSVKTNLHSLDKNQDILIWFGHSSYLFQVGGKRFLVDPVLSGSASPISFTVKAFEGADIFKPEDIPEIDYLLITHDHWDHLDYETILKLESKIGKVICGLGVGAHLEHWGYSTDKIIETDWLDKTQLSDSMTIHTLPARHFSGRGFKRNQTLWCSYVIENPQTKIFVGGDGGYDTHFAEIGKQFGNIDLAILENGQYNESWKYIHSLPNQFSQIMKDLKAKQALPVHSSKFKLANHAWDEPLRRVSELNKDSSFKIVTPIIGEKVFYTNLEQTFTAWWEDL